MDWIDAVLIMSGVGVCGLLHLAALALARRDGAEAGQEHSEQASTSSGQEATQ